MESKISSIAMNDPNPILDKLPELSEQFDYGVIDGPAGLQESVRAILLRADLAVCPVQASALALESAGDATYLIKQAQSVRNGLPAAALFLYRIRYAGGTRQGLRPGVSSFVQGNHWNAAMSRQYPRAGRSPWR